jgi:acyl-coenzyme A synthetase/AMP-(fatty) acid ligase
LGDQEALWSAIWAHNITHAIVTPADLLAITGQLQPDGLAFPSLQQLRVVGGALPDRLYALTRRKVTPHIALPYGTTETSLISWADASDLERFPNSCGKLMPGVELQAMSAQGEPLPAGESGELRVKVPGMAGAYVNNPERSQEKFKDGWFYTGDVGKISAEGYVYIQGRTDTRINMAGIKFFPEEVEAMLEQHPKVKAAGVFLADSGPEQENRLIAAIVPIVKSDPPRDLSRHCQQSQLGLMTPSAFLMVSELPMNLSAKLDRTAMARLFNPLVAP